MDNNIKIGTFFRLTLLVIFFFGIIIRLLGIYPGYPQTHVDEPTIVDSALRITFDFDFKPMGYYYGAFLPYVFAILNIFFILPMLTVYAPLFYLQKAITESSYALLFNCFHHQGEVIRACYFFPFKHIWDYSGRAETVIVSSFVIILIYFVTKNIFNKTIALITAFLTAINYRLVLSSFFSLPDGPSATTTVLSYYLSQKILTKGTYMNYLLAGLGVGVALSTKYFIYVIPPFLIFHIFGFWQANTTKSVMKKILLCVFNKKLLLAICISMIVFVSINFYMFIDWQNFKIQWEINSKRYGVFELDINSISHFSWFQLYYLTKYILGVVGTIFLIGGLIVALLKNYKNTIALLSLLLSFLLFFMVLSGSPNVRNFTPITPFLTIFISVFIYYFTTSIVNILKVKSILFLNAFILLLVALASFDNIKNSFSSAIIYNQTSSSKTAVDWMNNNLSKSDGVLQYWGAVIPPNLPLRINNIKPISEYYYSLQEIQNENLKWAIVSSDSQSYVNNERWLNNPELIKKSFFNISLLVNFLRQGYSNLVTQELYYYKVAEFSKLDSFINNEPSFFVSKIPSTISDSKLKLIYIVNNKTTTCNKEIFSFKTSSQKLYLVKIVVRQDKLVSYKDLYSKLNIDDSTFVSKQARFESGATEELIINGVSIGNSIASLELSKDKCLDQEKYLVDKVAIYETGLQNYLDKNGTNIDTKKKLPINFLWQLPL